MTESPELVVTPSCNGVAARVDGLDAARADGQAVCRLRRLWRRHPVLVLRGQSMDDDALVRFARRFGELDPPGPNPYGGPIHPTHPELNVISNIVEGGRPIGNLGAGEAVWHADMTYHEVPPKAGVLYAIELPAAGGDTHFADMRAAYDGLPGAIKIRIAALAAVHDAAHNSAGALRSGFTEVDDVRQTPGARHPLVRLDPVSGRRSLFLGRRPRAYVEGLEVAESDALLDELWALATRPELTHSHRWAVGDLVMWDNLSVLHRRDPFDPAARRRLHRAQIAGTEPVSGPTAANAARAPDTA